MKCKKSFTKKLRKYSNPEQAQKMAYKYLGRTAKICPSDRPEKNIKFMTSKIINGLILVKLVMKIIQNIKIKIEEKII